MRLLEFWGDVGGGLLAVSHEPLRESVVRRSTYLMLLFAPTVEARPHSLPLVETVPTIHEVVSAEGFTPTPSQSEIYRPGAVLVPNDQGSHDVVVSRCIDAEPEVAIMAQSSIATTLAAGVSARLALARGSASAGVEKRLSFVDPEQRTIALGALVPTEECRASVVRAESLQELSNAIVVHDVLVAIIQNTVCTRADTAGGVVALGAAEAATYSECVQESDGQVPLGFKSLPLARVLRAGESADASSRGPASVDPVAGEPAPPGPEVQQSTPSDSGQADGYLAELQARARAVEAARAELETLEAEQRDRLDAAEARLRTEASAAYSALATLHTAEPDSARASLEEFVARYDGATVTVTVAGEAAHRAVVVEELALVTAMLAPGPSLRPRTPGRILEATGMRMVEVETPGGSLLVSDSEVLQATYERVVGRNPSEFYLCGVDCPVEQVSWVDAVAFCNQLSEVEGLQPAYTSASMAARRVPGADGYRLPTQHEWRLLTTGETLYAGSDSVRDVAWTALNSEERTHPARRLRATPHGLYDLSGNVAEWLEDGTGASRLLAGGSWTDGPAGVVVGHIVAAKANVNAPSMGFRVVRME